MQTITIQSRITTRAAKRTTVNQIISTDELTRKRAIAKKEKRTFEYKISGKYY